jgi:hypothetical protein
MRHQLDPADGINVLNQSFVEDLKRYFARPLPYFVMLQSNSFSTSVNTHQFSTYSANIDAG